MDHEQAKAAIIKTFNAYKEIRNADIRKLKELTDGKLYELYVLSRVLAELKQRGFKIQFCGKVLQFKASPGVIDPDDSHFELFAPGSKTPDFKLYTDIEFMTLGSSPSHNLGKSSYHEIDIAVVVGNASGRPRFDEVALAVECKATGAFKKSIVKEVLGIRRELSFFVKEKPSILSNFTGISQELVPADPASEYWLVYIDPKGDDYKGSPAAFGIRFENWAP